MRLDRRTFLKVSGGVAIAADATACRRSPEQRAAEAAGSADYTIRIAPGLVELAPDRIIATTLYNNQFPGPLIRLREGRQATIDVYNDTDTPEQLHWHGQTVGVDVDGSAEEGTPFIAPHGHRRLTFTPGPPAVRPADQPGHVRADDGRPGRDDVVSNGLVKVLVRVPLCEINTAFAISPAANKKVDVTGSPNVRIETDAPTDALPVIVGVHGGFAQ